jgi:hypothetical protein
MQGINYDKNESGFFLHIVVSTQGQEASLVPNTPTATQNELTTTQAPEGADFMNGDIMIFVKKDHLFYCLSHSHESYIERFLLSLFEAGECGDRGKFVSLEKVGNIDKLSYLKRVGIKKISLNAKIYNASYKNLERQNKNYVQKMMNNVWTNIKSGFVSDDFSFNENDDIQAELSISPKGKVANENERQDKLLSFSRTLLEEEEEDHFSIITKNDGRIRSHELVLKEKKRLDTFGNSIYYKSAWNELEKYYLKLKDSNLISV